MKTLLSLCLAALLGFTPLLPAWASFGDVPAGFWAVDDIAYVIQHKLFNGTSGTTFEPFSNIDRAMLSTVLYRRAGEPGVSGTSPYSDVSAGQWYSDGITWAYQYRILPRRTLNSGRLGLTEDVRRCELCIMLYNFAKALGKADCTDTAPSSFSDMNRSLFNQAGCADLYDEAETAMLRWAVPLEIMRGQSDSTLDPLGYVTRAEAAAMLSRFDRIVLGGEEVVFPTAPPLSQVQLISQNPELPNGCEVTSLAMLLSCTGTAADKRTLYNNYLPHQNFSTRNGQRYGPNPNEYYVGNAASTNGGWYCFEEPVITAGDAWLSNQGIPYRMEKLSGLSRDQLEQYLTQDVPLVAWTTLHHRAPVFSNYRWYLPDGVLYTPYSNLHCVVLTGWDNGKYRIADPLYGWQSVSADTFWSAFDAMGRRALTLAPLD